jgi:RimJ/RimL family protein N-acetyltransferase
VTVASGEPLRARWRELVDRRLPDAARGRTDWPVRLDHCFARILLDNACGGPWRDSVAPPAWVNMPEERLAAALDLGEAVLAGRADLAVLDRRSLAWRGKLKVPPAPRRIETARLVLRRWRREDDAPFVALNADPEVMRYFPAPKSRDESLREARVFDGRFDSDGFGPWAVEVPGEIAFAGFVGCWRLSRPMPFAPVAGRGVEIGWRLGSAAWGRGFATEAARAALADAAGRCGLAEVVSFTASANLPSRRVMERLGMARCADFDHPGLPEGHPLAPHLLYRWPA